MTKYSGHNGQQNLWDKFWRDSHGKVVIWQFPNWPLFVWLIATVISLLLSGKVADAFSLIGTFGLVIWSMLEIFRGVNYFRRLMGLIVLGFSIATLIKTFS